jgi:hypothetical protein
MLVALGTQQPVMLKLSYSVSGKLASVHIGSNPLCEGIAVHLFVSGHGKKTRQDDGRI